MQTQLNIPTRGTLASLSLPMLLSSLGTSVANVALPTLADAFGTSFHDARWVVVSYLISVTAMVVLAGKLGDMFGRKRLLIAGIAVFAAATVLCAVADTLPALVAARAIQGVGGAMMMAMSMALISDVGSGGKSGSSMGLLASVSAVGTAVGPSLGGVLISAFSWRAIFLVNIPIAIVGLALVLRYAPDDRESQIRGSLSTGDTSAPRFAWLRDSALVVSLALSAIVSMVMMATLVVGPFYLKAVLHLNAAQTGFVMSIGPLMSALSGVPAGRLTDRVGPHRTTLLGLTGILVGCVLLSTLPTSLNVPGYAIPIVLATLGYSLFQTANNTAVMSNVLAERRGSVAGLLQFSRNLGLIGGAWAMGAVFATMSNRAGSTLSPSMNVAFGMRVTFTVAAALLIAAITIAISNHRRARSVAVNATALVQS